MHQGEISFKPHTEPTWEVFRVALKHMFTPPHHIRQCYDKLASMSQTGSVAQYTDAFIDLMLELPASVKEAQAEFFISRYISGLKYSIQKEVRLREQKDIETVQGQAIQVEESLRKAQDSFPMSLKGRAKTSTPPGNLKLIEMKKPSGNLAEKGRGLTNAVAHRRDG